jgi:putative transposase
MKRSKFTEAQIVFILQQAEEGTAVGEVCRNAGISESTFYYWRKKYAAARAYLAEAQREDATLACASSATRSI